MAGGRRGPAPLPTAVKEARGTQKSTRKNVREPKPTRGAPAMSDSMTKDKDAVGVWKRLVPALDKMKVLTKADGVALEGLCRAYSRAVQADRALEKHGLLVKTAWGTLQANPAVAISRTSWTEVRKYAQEFGLTPSSRSRVEEVPDESEGTASGETTAEDFLFRKRGQVVGKIG